MSVDLDAVPAPSEQRLAVRLAPAALREVRRGSPWVFDGSVTSVSHEGAAGDLAVVFDEQRRFAAIGLWDPTSPIRIKVLHVGDPRPIDAGFWQERLDASLERRAGLVADPDTTGFRLVHGENDGLPGFVADRYDDTIVVKLYTAAWFPYLRTLVPLVVERTGARRVVLRLARSVQPLDGLTDGAALVGDLPDGPVRFRERGLNFDADVIAGNKTGHFLDQRDNRALVRAAAEGASVLDVFSNTGGFAVSAAAGGARSVHLVDASAGAIEAARRNLESNRHVFNVRHCDVRTTVGDAFEVLRRLKAAGERYDVVVLDPPSFASAERDVPGAIRAYRRLTRAGLAVLAPKGLLVQASCSSRVDAESFYTAVQEAATADRVELREERRTGHGVDHPIGFEHGAYLKAVFARRIR